MWITGSYPLPIAVLRLRERTISAFELQSGEPLHFPFDRPKGGERRTFRISSLISVVLSRLGGLLKRILTEFNVDYKTNGN